MTTLEKAAPQRTDSNRTGSRRVLRAVEDGLRRWRNDSERTSGSAANGVSSSAYQELFPSRLIGDGHDLSGPVIGSMPRRAQMIKRSSGATAPLQIDVVDYDVGTLAALARLGKWIFLVMTFVAGILGDKLRRLDDVDRRARRLRVGLERLGGTFVKFGQQAAMRIDLLPWEYCVELSNMLDRMPPFPLEEALAAIERTTGRPWDELFSYFDPDPVGSASVACVYQAVLKDGTKVAVKIRRPGIGQMFAADFVVLNWMFRLIEYLTILRPGFTKNLRLELRETLMEELDFTKEARFQNIFRREAKKSELKYFSAPRVFFEISGSEMIVQEFVSGMWLWEVIAAVEHNDPQGLAMMAELNIQPKRVAKRVMWSAFWSMDENLFFHADPHPANILVQQDGKLIYIDFGSCGAFNQEQRAALERIVLGLKNGDAEGMARATLKLLEPFSPVDVNMVMREAQAEYARVLTTFRTKSKYTEWWERTSARQWLSLIRLTRKHNMPVNLHTLRMIRATLLYDTLVLRLHPSADRYDQYTKFMKHRAKLVRKKFRRQYRQRPKDSFFLRLEEFAETADDILLQAQHMASTPVLNFGSMVDKWIFAAAVTSRTAGRLLLLTLLSLAIAFVTQRATVPAMGTRRLVLSVLTNNVYLVLAGTILIINLRHIYSRLTDRDAA